MQRRTKLSKSKSRKYFKKTVDKTHKFNNTAPIQRGGLRL